MLYAEFPEWLEKEPDTRARIDCCIEVMKNAANGEPVILEAEGKAACHALYRALEDLAGTRTQQVINLAQVTFRRLCSLPAKSWGDKDWRVARWKGSVGIALSYVALLKLDDHQQAKAIARLMLDEKAPILHAQNALNQLRATVLSMALNMAASDHDSALLDYMLAVRLFKVGSSSISSHAPHHYCLGSEIQEWATALGAAIGLQRTLLPLPGHVTPTIETILANAGEGTYFQRALRAATLPLTNCAAQ